MVVQAPALQGVPGRQGDQVGEALDHQLPGWAQAGDTHPQADAFAVVDTIAAAAGRATSLALGLFVALLAAVAAATALAAPAVYSLWPGGPVSPTT